MLWHMSSKFRQLLAHCSTDLIVKLCCWAMQFDVWCPYTELHPYHFILSQVKHHLPMGAMIAVTRYMAHASKDSLSAPGQQYYYSQSYQSSLLTGCGTAAQPCRCRSLDATPHQADSASGSDALAVEASRFACAALELCQAQCCAPCDFQWQMYGQLKQRYCQSVCYAILLSGRS